MGGTGADAGFAGTTRMPLTELEHAIDAFRDAERAMGAAQRKDDSVAKAAAAQAKRTTAQTVKTAAEAASAEPWSPRQRRVVTRAFDYLRRAGTALKAG